MPKAVILFSGGLDSTVVLALAHARQCECYALSFDYGQKNHVELQAAQEIAAYYRVTHHIIKIDPFYFKSSALLSPALQVERNRSSEEIARQGIPNTYVPARNTLFLSYALGFTESIQAQEIHIGANRMDHTGYPDCTPAYMQAFQSVIDIATKQSIEEFPPKLMAPLVEWDKAKIIRQGLALQAPLELTISCYHPISRQQPCQTCDACILRAEGFVHSQQMSEMYVNL